MLPCLDNYNLTILKDDTKIPRVDILIDGIKYGKIYSEIQEFFIIFRLRQQGYDFAASKKAVINYFFHWIASIGYRLYSIASGNSSAVFIQYS